MSTNNLRNKLRLLRALNNIYFFRMILGIPFRLFFGNDAGLRENYQGRKSIQVNSKISDSSFEFDNRALELKKMGFIKLGNIISKELISTIQSAYLKKIKDVESLGKADVIYLKPALHQIPELKHLIENEKIKNLVRSYYNGCNFEIQRVEAWRNYNWGDKGLTKDINSNLFHNDQSSIDILKIFIYLSDGITKNNGATRIFSIPKTKKIMRTGYLQRYAILWPAKQIVNNTKNLNFMEGNAGFCFIFNPQLTLHAAGLVSGDSVRDVVCISLKASDKALAENWDKKIIDNDLAYMAKHNIKVM